MFLVIEIQTAADGTVSTLVTQHQTRNEAESKYYLVLSAAAVSSVPLHAAMLCYSNGNHLLSKSYEHAPQLTEE
jgi:hypothetical protein